VIHRTAQCPVTWGGHCTPPSSRGNILATARAHAATLWTQDADLKGREGVRFVRA